MTDLPQINTEQAAVRRRKNLLFNKNLVIGLMLLVIATQGIWIWQLSQDLRAAQFMAAWQTDRFLEEKAGQGDAQSQQLLELRQTDQGLRPPSQPAQPPSNSQNSKPFLVFEPVKPVAQNGPTAFEMAEQTAAQARAEARAIREMNTPEPQPQFFPVQSDDPNSPWSQMQEYRRLQELERKFSPTMGGLNGR